MVRDPFGHFDFQFLNFNFQILILILSFIFLIFVKFLNNFPKNLIW